MFCFVLVFLGFGVTETVRTKTMHIALSKYSISGMTAI